MNWDTSRAYDILGIDEDAIDEITIDVIKRQYKRKALQYHPDKNKSQESVHMFREVAEAYQYLVKHESWKNWDSKQNIHDISTDDLRDILRQEFADIFGNNSDHANEDTASNQSPYINILLSFLENAVGKDGFSGVKSATFALHPNKYLSIILNRFIIVVKIGLIKSTALCVEFI